jgi:hypothetical protein
VLDASSLSASVISMFPNVLARSLSNLTFIAPPPLAVGVPNPGLASVSAMIPIRMSPAARLIVDVAGLLPVPPVENAVDIMLVTPS